MQQTKEKEEGRRSSRGFYILVGVLLAVVAVGTYAWSVQLRNGLVVSNMRDVVSWGLYISLFAWFVGVSAGGLIVSSAAAVFRIKQWQPIAKIANFVAAVVIAVAAFSILPDLGRPDRILNLFLYPNLTSPLIWDVTIIFTYLIISLVELGLLISAENEREKGNESRYLFRERIVRGLAFVALPVAVLTHSITAWIFGLQISRPLWNTALLAPLFLASALVSGLGLVILVTVLGNRFASFKVEKETIAGLARLLGVIILVDLFLLASEYVTVVWPGSPTEVSPFVVEFFGPYGWLAWTQWAFAALAFVIVAVPRFRASMLPVTLASLLVLLEVFFYRLELIIPAFVNPLVQYPPGTSIGTSTGGSSALNGIGTIYNPGFSFQLVGSYFPSAYEWSIAMGIVALAALLIVVGIHFLPIKPAGEASSYSGSAGGATLTRATNDQPRPSDAGH